MINTDDFIKRLETILEYYGVSASVFADKIGVQRSGLSHLLSGRNKPSLDFVMRITDNYPEVDLYWLLMGEGNFPKNENNQQSKESAALSSYEQSQDTSPDLFSQEKKHDDKTDEIISDTRPKNTGVSPLPPVNSSNVEQVAIFYKDGTFKVYKPQT